MEAQISVARTTVDGALECACEIDLVMMQYKIDVLRCSGTVSKSEFERDPAFDGESMTIADFPRLFEKTGENHVRDPGANSALADAKLLCIGARVLGQHAGRWRRSGRRRYSASRPGSIESTLRVMTESSQSSNAGVCGACSGVRRLPT